MPFFEQSLVFELQNPCLLIMNIYEDKLKSKNQVEKFNIIPWLSGLIEEFEKMFSFTYISSI